MNFTLDERLNQILPHITSRDFLDSKGQATKNERHQGDGGEQ